MQTEMKPLLIDEKTLRQFIQGVIIGDIHEMTIEKANEAKAKAVEIIDFMKEHGLLKFQQVHTLKDVWWMRENETRNKRN